MPVVHSLELRLVCYLDLMGEKTASERLSELPKVMQIVKGGGEIRTQIYLVFFSGHCKPPDTIIFPWLIFRLFLQIVPTPLSPSSLPITL